MKKPGKGVEVMVREAVAYYATKRGCKPALIRMNDSLVDVGDESFFVDGIEVRPSGQMSYPSWLFLIDPDNGQKE